MKTNTANPQDISQENVSVAAYNRWLAAGEPFGRDQEFWLKAEMDLRKMVSQIPHQAIHSPLEPRIERTQPHRTAPAGPARSLAGRE